jgi:uncharacterized protein YwqG
VTLTELTTLARTAGFQPDAIRTLARPGAVLRPIEGARDRCTRGSWLGGVPRLPRSTPWPRRNGRSLAFVAQIDLAAQPPGVAAAGLPAAGHLAFFYDVAGDTWGLEPTDAGGFAVVYVPPGAGLDERDAPYDVPAEGRFGAVALTPAEVITLPPTESVAVDALGLSRGQADLYEALVQRLADDDPWAERCLLGGHPDQIQDDIMLACAKVTGAALPGGGPTATRRVPDVRQQARDWQLLLQIPSREDGGMVWGDCGCLYFCMHADSLRARRWDRAWMVMQCC